MVLSNVCLARKRLNVSNTLAYSGKCFIAQTGEKMMSRETVCVCGVCVCVCVCGCGGCGGVPLLPKFYFKMIMANKI